MENKLRQEPAFSKSAYVSNEGSIDPPQEGMSKRFYAACSAMQGLIASTAGESSYPQPLDIIIRAYEFADELLKQE